MIVSNIGIHSGITLMESLTHLLVMVRLNDQKATLSEVKLTVKQTTLKQQLVRTSLHYFITAPS